MVIPFIIAAGIIYVQLSDFQMKAARENAIHFSADVAQRIEDFLSHETRLISSFAADPDIIHASKTGDYTIAARELADVFDAIGWSGTTMFLADRNGTIKVDPRFAGQIGLNLSDREYFIKAKNGQTNISVPLYARGTSDYDIVMVLCTPIREGQEFFGVAAMVFSTNFLVDIITRPVMGNSGYAYLLNKEGQILIHPEKDLISKQILDGSPATRAVKPLMESNQPGIAEYVYEGQKKIAGVSPVGLIGWTVVYAQPLDKIMAPVNRLLLSIFISGIVFLGITVLTIYIFFSRLSTPIQKMMEMVAQVSRHATEALVQIGPDRKIIFANPAFEKITGIALKDVIGAQPLFENSGGLPRESIWQALESGNPWSGHLEFKAEGQKTVAILDVMIVPLKDDRGRIQGYLEIGRDVTDELMFEKRLSQAQKLEAIGTLAGGIAHDFNNILSIIFGYTELSLLHPDLDPKLKDHLRQIATASERARSLVTQILSFSRQSKMELVPFMLKTVVKEALTLLRASMPAFIRIDANIDSSSAVMGDPTRIHQVVMNLFTNAVHAIGESPGTIGLALEDFMVDREFTRTHPGIKEGKHIILRVSDTGCGMPAQTVDHIFDPFFTTKAQGKGTGLGLSVVHGIIKKMNGIITVYSRVGKGTVFNVILPCITEDKPDIQQIRSPIRRGTERIALIDDETDIVAAMRSILENLGYRVTAFTDSVAGLSAIESGPDEFDLIITDYTMPGITGLELAGKLDRAGIRIPILLMSGFFGEKIKAAAHDAGIDHLLYKPVNTYRLSAAICRALGNSDCG